MNRLTARFHTEQIENPNTMIDLKTAISAVNDEEEYSISNYNVHIGYQCVSVIASPENIMKLIAKMVKYENYSLIDVI